MVIFLVLQIHICYVFDSFFLLFSICIVNLIVVQKNKYIFIFLCPSRLHAPHPWSCTVSVNLFNFVTS